jgi:hypothetical protein
MMKCKGSGSGLSPAFAQRDRRQSRKISVKPGTSRIRNTSVGHSTTTFGLLLPSARTTFFSFFHFQHLMRPDALAFTPLQGLSPLPISRLSRRHLMPTFHLQAMCTQFESPSLQSPSLWQAFHLWHVSKP